MLISWLRKWGYNKCEFIIENIVWVFSVIKVIGDISYIKGYGLIFY